MLASIKNIQASWRTVGKKVARTFLHLDGNTMGLITMKINVALMSDALHIGIAEDTEIILTKAGFNPQLKNQHPDFKDVLNNLEQ